MTSKQLSSLPAASTLTGAELYYGVQAGADVKVTGTQLSPGSITPVLNDPASAASNVALIQAALNAGGNVTLKGSGIVWINTTLVISSGTELFVPKGMTIRAAASTGAVLVNAASVSSWAATLYNSGGSITTGPLSLIWDFNTPAWVHSTVYAKGNYVVNGGNIYWCATAGTSAGSGGPTGTGTNIVDGTAHWNYVTVAASDPNSTELFVVVNWPSHGRSVGDCVWLTPQPDAGTSNYWSGTQTAGTRGGPCDSAYFGIFPVRQINDTNNITIALYRSPAAAFSGIPMNIKVADQDIVFGGGGTLDYNFPTNNTSGNPIAVNCCVMAGVKGCDGQGMNFTNATEFALCLGGVADGQFNEMNTPLGSQHDRCKIYGPAFGINFHDSHGIDGDDSVSIHTQETITFASNIIACGDCLDITVTHISGDGGIKPFTVFAQHTLLYTDNISVEHIGGVWDGGQVTIFGSNSAPVGTVNVRNVMNRGLSEPVVNVVGSGCKIDVLNIEQCVKNPVDGGSAMSGQMLIMDTTTTTIGTVNIRDSKGIIYGNFVQIINGTIGVINIDGCNVNFPTITSGAAVMQTSASGNAIVGQVNISKTAIIGQPNYFVIDQSGMIVNLSDIYAPTASSGGILSVQSPSGGTISLQNVFAPNISNGIRFNASVTQTVYSGYGNNIGTWFTLDTTNSITPYGFDIKMDVAHATITAGAFCYNTNSASGPVGPTAIGTNFNLTSADASSTNLNITNTSAGGHSFQFFSTGSGNGPGEFGVYDNTARSGSGQTDIIWDGTTGNSAAPRDAVWGWSTDQHFPNFGAGAPDTGLARNAAGVIEANNGTKGTLRDFIGRDIYSADVTFFIRTKATLTNNAAAQIATLTNGPTAGNPTKWIAIDDNGTTRFIPAW